MGFKRFIGGAIDDLTHDLTDFDGRGMGGKGILKDVITSDVDKNNIDESNNGKDNNPQQPERVFTHPKILTYPLAVTPDEENGSRLLIKCFKYVAPKTSTKHNFALSLALRDGVDDATKIKYKKGDAKKNKDGTYQIDPTNTQLINDGASDQIGQKESHLYYVELPIPQDVNDSNTVTWGDDSMNILQLAGLAIAGGAVDNLGLAFDQAKSLLAGGIISESGLPDDTKKAVSAAIAGKAIGALGQNIRPNSAIARATGKVLNSNLELLFDSVNLRSFPFSITFSPRNSKESMRVKHIIRAFKSSMAAKKGTNKTGQGQGGIFLSSPDVFHLRYLHNGKDHPFLNSFKHCALTGMTVNYTNAGTFASYKDGTPVSIQMNLTFKELNPIYHEDYERFKSDALGVGF